MQKSLLAAPALEPVSLDEMKSYLKLDQDEQNSLIQALITSARIHLENYLGLQFLTQTWRVNLKAHQSLSGDIRLPVQPVQNISAITVRWPNGELQALPAEHLHICQSQNPAIVRFDQGQGAGLSGQLQIELVAGFGSDADQVPAPLSLALKIIVANWFEHRLIADPAVWPQIQQKIEPLIAPYKSQRLI